MSFKGSSLLIPYKKGTINSQNRAVSDQMRDVAVMSCFAIFLASIHPASLASEILGLLEQECFYFTANEE